MAFRMLFIIAMLLVFTTSAWAEVPENSSNTSTQGDLRLLITLRSYAEKQVIRNIHVTSILENTQTGIRKTELHFAGQDGSIQINTPPGAYLLELFVDAIETPGKDYYINQTIFLEYHTRETLYLFSVGSIRGTVQDENKVSLPNATISLSCGSSYGITGQVLSDNAGTYWFDWAPVGLCQVTAVKDGMSATQDIMLTQGSLETSNVTMERQVELPKEEPAKIVPEIVIRGTNNTAVFILGAIIVFGTTGMFIFWGRKQHTEKKEKTGKRQADILATLSPRERDIIEFILKNEGAASQSKIRYDLGIPKTSLVRLLMGLEVKNIITIKKVGKLRKVYLTDFFKGK